MEPLNLLVNRNLVASDTRRQFDEAERPTRRHRRRWGKPGLPSLTKPTDTPAHALTDRSMRAVQPRS
jgi:hypothetical protein